MWTRNCIMNVNYPRDDHPASSEEFVERARDLEGTFGTSGCPDAGHPPDIFPERLHLLAFICSMAATRNVYSSHYSRDLTGNRKIYRSLVRASPRVRINIVWTARGGTPLTSCC